MRRFDAETAVACIELEQMLVDLNREIDFNGGVRADEFYCHDCVADLGSISFRGRIGAKKYYADRLDSFRTRQKDGIRTTRHMFANLHIAVHEPNRATLSCVVITYGGEGIPPVTSGTAPAAISDARYECRLEADGAWRIAGLYGSPVFVGEDPYARTALLGP